MTNPTPAENPGPPMIHTAQDNTTVTRLITYRANDSRVHVERVSVYLANVLDEAGLLIEMGGPDDDGPRPAWTYAPENLPAARAAGYDV